MERFRIIWIEQCGDDWESAVQGIKCPEHPELARRDPFPSVSGKAESVKDNVGLPSGGQKNVGMDGWWSVGVVIAIDRIADTFDRAPTLPYRTVLTSFPVPSCPVPVQEKGGSEGMERVVLRTGVCVGRGSWGLPSG